MTEHFSFDVFLSYSSKDRDVVRDVAARLRDDGLNVWFDEWMLKRGDDVPAKIEEALQNSRVLVLCTSANVGSQWESLEATTFRFRDPLNTERCFIPLRLDETPVGSFITQAPYIDWRPAKRAQEYKKLLDACRLLAKEPDEEATVSGEPEAEKVVDLEYELHGNDYIYAYAFSSDRKRALTASGDATVRLWDTESGLCLKVLRDHKYDVRSVAWNANETLALSCGTDRTLKVWDVEAGRCLRSFKAHSKAAQGVAWNPDGVHVLSCGEDHALMLWNIETGFFVRKLKGHRDLVWAVIWINETEALSVSADGTLRHWDVASGSCLRVLEGHTDAVHRVAWAPDRRIALTASNDRTIRSWDLDTGRCLRVLEGHTDFVVPIVWHDDQQRALSGSADKTIRLWDVHVGHCLGVLRGHKAPIRSVVWSEDGNRAFSGDQKGCIRIWDLSRFMTKSSSTMRGSAREQVQYTNAKVLMVGESGVGKTGLSKRLVLNNWEPTDSTVGAWATQWKIPVSSPSSPESNGQDQPVEREIWLWDFGGQADQRLIHQLYMDETSLAVLVFDGQKEDLFETLGQWDLDLTRAARKEFSKILVAGRVDTGGLRVSRSDVEKFAAERKFGRFLETSAKHDVGCKELKEAILETINWDEIPCRTTEVLFKRLKEEIIQLKDEGRVLMRFNELRETLRLRLSGEFKRFTDDELHAVLSLLAGPCVVWELAFGSWVLLQPERINAYAQAVIRTLQEDEHQRGCLMEERVLNGVLAYESSKERLEGDEERFVLLAMHQTLVERGLCLRQPTPKGNLLVFPSYYRRERPEQVKFPAVLVSYRFVGFLDEIYATLVVRLHHTDSFKHDRLWRYAADFNTNTNKQLGVKLTRIAPGLGELEVYFDPSVSMEMKIIFSKYVHEHLLQQAREVERLRHYVCLECGTPVGNRELAMKRLDEWLQGRFRATDSKSSFSFLEGKERGPSIMCVGCEKRVPLWDEMEESFASPEIQQRVRDMQAGSAVVLDNESRERVLVGEVISTVALAGQICREFSVSDHGIDMEIEFKNDAHQATGVKLYLQLKSGDSYLRKRHGDGAEVFTIKNDRLVRHWMDQQFPVLLVIRNSAGEVRWMEVRDWLRHANSETEKLVKQIVFEGERFDVMSVRRWRERCLSERS